MQHFQHRSDYPWQLLLLIITTSTWYGSQLRLKENLWTSCLKPMDEKIETLYSVIPVIHGMPVTIADVPWQALIKFRSSRRNFGGGGLIGPRFLLTAAHVVRNHLPSDIHVTVGMTTQGKHEGILMDVEKVVLHPGYNPSVNRNRGNDIAILLLKEPVPESTKVKYIDLPPNPEATPAPGTAALVSGWGRTMKRMRSQSLMAAIVPVASRNACIEAYTNRYDPILQIPITLTPDMLCAGTGKENEPYACQGDSGSVLGVPVCTRIVHYTRLCNG
uniref:Peptidase S1 domain-containing protein n=1 Tax=Eptatretus burgeri TaxID=7764 RepID=A0A8C4NJW5_EPTBU